MKKLTALVVAGIMCVTASFVGVGCGKISSESGSNTSGVLIDEIDAYGNEYPAASDIMSSPGLMQSALNDFDISKYNTENELKYDYELKIYSENEDFTKTEQINVSNNDYWYTEGDLIGKYERLCKILDEYNTDMESAANEYDPDFNYINFVLLDSIYERIYMNKSDIEESLVNDTALVTVNRKGTEDSNDCSFSAVLDSPLTEGIRIGDAYFNDFNGFSDIVCRCSEDTRFVLDKPGAAGTVRAEEYKASDETEE